MPFDRPSLPRTPQAGRRRGRCPRRHPLPLHNVLFGFVREVGIAVVFTAALSVILSGCGVPGTPVPRRPVIPLPVNDLVAQQRGDAVVVRFTLPKNSIEQEALAEPPAVDIYRGTPGPKPSSRLVDTIPGDAMSQYEQSGQVEFLDPLDPSEIASAPGRQWTYTVRTRVSAAHPLLTQTPPQSESIHRPKPSAISALHLQRQPLCWRGRLQNARPAVCAFQI